VLQSEGKVHDSESGKRVQDMHREKKIELIADKGYQGIKRFLENSRIPIKTKGNSLTAEEAEEV
jgi:hypothetical protein